jgi:plasmid stabilization system protein ParE
MYAIFIRSEALTDMKEARDWYDSQSIGLGDRFYEALTLAFARIAETPYIFPTVQGDIHRALIRRYPYALFFEIDGQNIYILACAHTRRDPRHHPH